MNTAKTLPPAYTLPRDDKGDIEREYLLYRVRVALGSLNEVGLRLGLSRRAGADALRGKAGRRVDSAIAEILGMRLEEVWPSRYSTRSEADRRQAERRQQKERRRGRRTLRQVGKKAT